MNSEKQPLYILAVAPHEPAKLRLFESGAGSISDLLMIESGFRYAGWDLSTGKEPKIIKGEYLEAKIEGMKNINLYEDGRFICWVTAGPNFLAWPLSEDEFNKKPRLNPMAIVEVTYNFVNFYKKLIPFFIKTPEKFRFVVQLKNAFLTQDTELYLIPGGLQSIEWLINRVQYVAPENDMDKYEDVDIMGLKQNEGHVAYLLVEKLYLWFGIGKNLIPYISGEKGKEIIDVEKIKTNKGL